MKAKIFELLAAALLGALGVITVNRFDESRKDQHALSLLSVELRYNRDRLRDIVTDGFGRDPISLNTSAFQSLVSSQLSLPDDLNTRLYKVYACVGDIEQAREYWSSGKARKAGSDEGDVLEYAHRDAVSAVKYSESILNDIEKRTGESWLHAWWSRESNQTVPVSKEFTLTPCASLYPSETYPR